MFKFILFAAGAVTGAVAQTCTPTGYLCFEDGDVEYCSKWERDSVCYRGKCYGPANCNFEGKVASSRSASDLLGSALRLFLLDELVQRLQAPGEDQDTVPEEFEHLIAEMKADKMESTFSTGDMKIEDMVNAYHGLGYKEAKKVKENLMSAMFDDEIAVKGKAIAYGQLYRDSFTIRACVDVNSKVPALAKLMAVNTWNEKTRMSTAYLDSDDGSLCLQSDAQLTKYAKANIQIAKEQAAYFTVSIQLFHKSIVELSIKNFAEF
jgi:hypothetical protein